MKKIIIAAILFFPFLASASAMLFQLPDSSIFVHSDEPLCVVSASISHFYPGLGLITLDVPEWNNATTSTVGIPQCETDFYLGDSSSLALSAFGIDDKQNIINLAIVKIN